MIVPHAIARLAAGCFWCGVLAVAWLSVAAGPPIPLQVHDKLLHAGAYLWLGLSAGIAYAGRARLAVPFVLVATYGTGLELVQLTLPTRTGEIGDLVANFVGAAAGTALAGWLLAGPERGDP